MTNKAATLALLVVSTGQAIAQPAKDPPFNPYHINSLPPEVRRSVQAMCATTPAAGHYFALHRDNEITLHFELFQCGRPTIDYCKASQCLHQVYRFSDGHYRLVKSAYGPKSD